MCLSLKASLFSAKLPGTSPLRRNEGSFCMVQREAHFVCFPLYHAKRTKKGRSGKKLVGIERVEVHAGDQLVVGIQDRVVAQHKFGIALPGRGVLQAPFAARIGVARTQKVLAGKDQALVWKV